MTLMGKILVLLNLVLSFIFLGFAAVVGVTRPELKKQLDVQTAAVAKAQSETAGFRQQLDAAQVQLKDQKAAAAKSESESSRIIADLKKQVDNFADQLRRSSVDVAKTNAETAIATKEQVARKNEVDKLRETRESLIAQNQDLAKKNTELQDTLAQTKNDLDLTNSRNQQMLSKVQEYEAFIVRKVGNLPDDSELRAGSDVPPPPDVEGVVRRVDPSGKYIELNVGADDGFRKGQMLEVWRGGATPKYIGRIRIEMVEANVSVAKPVSTTAPILVDDKVAPRINVHGN